MLVAKRKSVDLRVIAASEARTDGPWTCPSCGDNVAIKKGLIKIHHFAHFPPVRCEFGLGESEAHRQCKTEIYNALRIHPRVSSCEIEFDLGSVRPDIFAHIDGQSVAIEVQISSLSREKILHRTLEYAKKRIAVLWVGLWHKGLSSPRVAPTAWEKWLHAVYFGRVYYWRAGEEVTAVHFGEHLIYVDIRSWHTSYDHEESAGGYHRVSKRWRTPLVAPESVSITSMGSIVRAPWSGRSISVPECRVRLDRLPKWWTK